MTTSPVTTLLIGGPADGQIVPMRYSVYQVLIPPSIREMYGNDAPDAPIISRTVTYHLHTFFIGRWMYAVASPDALPTEKQQDDMIDALIEHPASAQFRVGLRGGKPPLAW